MAWSFITLLQSYSIISSRDKAVSQFQRNKLSSIRGLRHPVVLGDHPSGPDQAAGSIFQLVHRYKLRELGLPDGPASPSIIRPIPQFTFSQLDQHSEPQSRERNQGICWSLRRELTWGALPFSTPGHIMRGLLCANGVQQFLRVGTPKEYSACRLVDC